MTCQACDRAAEEPSHDFTATCRGCWARSVARSPLFHAAKDATRDDPEREAKREAYRALMQRFSLTHQEVLAALETDVLTRSASAR
jgi:hypothetical protein